MAARDCHLVSAYRASLARAVEAGCTTVGFCILSAGVFRGARALEDVLQIGVRTLAHEVRKYSGLKCVHLIGYTSEEQSILARVGAEVTEELARGGDGSDHDLVRELLF
jgi:O-acetyl-ADP-ribose deacetylase (regulator of RNase III)